MQLQHLSSSLPQLTLTLILTVALTLARTPSKGSIRPTCVSLSGDIGRQMRLSTDKRSDGGCARWFSQHSYNAAVL